MKKLFKDIIAFVVGIPFGVIAFAAMVVSVLCMLTVKVCCVIIGYLSAVFQRLNKEERDETIETIEDNEKFEDIDDGLISIL